MFVFQEILHGGLIPELNLPLNGTILLDESFPMHTHHLKWKPWEISATDEINPGFCYYGLCRSNL